MDMYIRIIKSVAALSFIAGLLIITGCNTEGTQNPLDSGSEWKQIVNLSGNWKFSVGDNFDWSSAGFNDDNWESIEVPSSWENQGFHGYDGYAWYRNTFTIPEKYKGSMIYLFLGYVDDVDQVFINGKQVGYSGSFPPQYRTAYDVDRQYPVPPDVVYFNKKNTIAVRVYDEQLEGGILSGDIGIYTPQYSIQNGINLAGLWKFRTGDNPGWKENKYDDSDWAELIVPGHWETQGFPDYDGFAWYRKSVTIPEKYKNEKLILVMGKIDDLDQVYLNGKLVGSTGDMETRSMDDNYLKLRGYYISHKDLNFGGENLIAVRVYDGFIDGGIYEGPVTIVPQEDYTAYWNRIRRGNNIMDEIFN